MHTKGVYAASFDPITNGHLWVIDQGYRLFDELVVAIGTNPDKRYTFSLEERLDFIRDATKDYPNITVDSYENQYLVTYARAIKASFIIRGIRTEGDYEYERRMRHLNSDLDPGITTVFLMPPRDIAEISSSAVKGLVGPAGWEEVVRRFVPDVVYQALLRRYGEGVSLGE